MYPFSYTSLKIIHDQEIKEAMEQQRFAIEQRMQRPGRFQAFGMLLNRMIENKHDSLISVFSAFKALGKRAEDRYQQ